MSTPDARLNAAERAALAGLEAAAAAADPHLAARLRSGRSQPTLAALQIRFLTIWASVLKLRAFGPPLTMFGLVLITLGLSAGLSVSIFGVAAALIGLRLTLDLVEVRADKRFD